MWRDPPAGVPRETCMSENDRSPSVEELAAVGYGVTGVRDGAPRGPGMFSIFPLLTISFLIYALLSYTIGPGWTTHEFPPVMMISGEEWVISGGDLFIIISFIFLFWEVVRSTSAGTDSIINHVLSSLVFIACFFCFLVLAPFATSTFFLLTIMTLLDMIAGFVVTIKAARRDFGVSGG